MQKNVNNNMSKRQIYSNSWGYGSPNTDWFPKMSKILKKKIIEFKIPNTGKTTRWAFGAFPKC